MKNSFRELGLSALQVHILAFGPAITVRVVDASGLCLLGQKVQEVQDSKFTQLFSARFTFPKVPVSCTQIETYAIDCLEEVLDSELALLAHRPPFLRPGGEPLSSFTA